MKFFLNLLAPKLFLLSWVHYECIGVSCKHRFVVQVPWNRTCKAGHLVHMFAQESAEERPSEATPQYFKYYTAKTLGPSCTHCGSSSSPAPTIPCHVCVETPPTSRLHGALPDGGNPGQKLGAVGSRLCCTDRWFLRLRGSSKKNNL